MTCWQRRAVAGVMIIGTCLLAACGRQQLSLLDGGTLAWESLRGRWVVINYWAYWCKPCIEEIPELNLLASTYPEQVAVLGVNFDGVQPPLLEQQRQQLQIEFDVFVHDPSQQLALERPAVLPTTLIFSPDGKLQATLAGPQTAQALAQAMGLISPAAAPLSSTP